MHNSLAQSCCAVYCILAAHFSLLNLNCFMELRITYTYNGEAHSPLQDAFQKATIDGIKNYIKARLTPFINQIEESGGTIHIDINNEFETKLQFRNMRKNLLIK
jgi:hypothetical protein